MVLALLCLSVLNGCMGKNETPAGKQEPKEEVQAKAEANREQLAQARSSMEERMLRFAEPTVEEVDWEAYFDGLNGAGVIYDPEQNLYQVYHPELAQTRRSPCSTFKIISSLIGLQEGVIVPEGSVRTWSGETFWNEDWNRDIGFEDAFRTSCVWYFREVIDEIGAERMQTALDSLAYGNCDISDWEGRLNTNNQNRALTGFWIESSLKISPKEQTEVMERIFGAHSEYSEEVQNRLKQVMRVEEAADTDWLVYGKTGLGKTQGITVDAWFTGFAEQEDRRVYFCIYLGRTDGANVTSTKAKEIALQVIAGEA